MGVGPQKLLNGLLQVAIGSEVCNVKGTTGNRGRGMPRKPGFDSRSFIRISVGVHDGILHDIVGKLATVGIRKRHFGRIRKEGRTERMKEKEGRVPVSSKYEPIQFLCRNILNILLPLVK